MTSLTKNELAHIEFMNMKIFNKVGCLQEIVH